MPEELPPQEERHVEEIPDTGLPDTDNEGHMTPPAKSRLSRISALASRRKRKPNPHHVHLIGLDGISTIGRYMSLDGTLPEIGDLIDVGEDGRRARVTDIWPDNDPPIRAELVPRQSGTQLAPFHDAAAQRNGRHTVINP